MSYLWGVQVEEGDQGGGQGQGGGICIWLGWLVSRLLVHAGQLRVGGWAAGRSSICDSAGMG